MRENKRELPTTQANDESKREKDRTRLKSTITTVTNQTVTTGEPVRDPTRGSCSHTHTHTTLQGSASAGSTRAVHEAEATNSQHSTRSHPPHAQNARQQQDEGASAGSTRAVHEAEATNPRTLQRMSMEERARLRFRSTSSSPQNAIPATTNFPPLYRPPRQRSLHQIYSLSFLDRDTQRFPR